MAPPALRLVDGSIADHHGEVVEVIGFRALMSQLKTTELELKLAEKELGRERKRLEMARLDDEVKRQREPKRPTIIDVWQEWQEATGHTKASLDAERFDAVRKCLYMIRDPTTENPERRYSRKAFSMAIAGAAYDPFIGKPGRNGKRIRFDDLKTICSGAASMDRHCRYAPTDWVYVPRPATPDQEFEKDERVPAEREMYDLALEVLADENEVPVYKILEALRRARTPE